MRSGRGIQVAAGCFVGALVASCSSDPAPPALPAPFAQADCQGQLVEVVRFSNTYPDVLNVGMSNNLATDGATLFLAYSFSSSGAFANSGLPASGGVVAVPLAGGPPQVVAAADVARTSQWGTGSFWVGGGQSHLQTEGQLTSLPADAATPATLDVVISELLSVAYTHDAEFGYYAAAGGGHGIYVGKVAIDGGSQSTLVDEPLGAPEVGGMADAGDALLLQVRWQTDSP